MMGIWTDRQTYNDGIYYAIHAISLLKVINSDIICMNLCVG